MNLSRLVTPHTTLIYATTHSLNLNPKKRAVVTQPRVKLCAAAHLLIIHMTLCYIHQCCPLSLMFSDKYHWLNMRSRYLMLRSTTDSQQLLLWVGNKASVIHHAITQAVLQNHILGQQGSKKKVSLPPLENGSW